MSSDDFSSTYESNEKLGSSGQIESEESNTSYEFIEQIGAGGQGKIWKAIRSSDGKTVALKILQANNDESMQIAVGEIQKLQAMSSPQCQQNVICYYGYNLDMTDGNILIEMEYIEGKTLSEYAKELREKGEYDKLYKHLLLITKDLIKGLLWVHQKNIIHNDIKPDNIMIDKKLTPKLIDFGVACDSHDICRLDSISTPCCKGFSGTIAYASPEMYEHRLRYPQSDIWSLGMSLYEAATGKTPYDYGTSKPNVRDIFQAVQDKTPKKLETSNLLLNEIVNKSLVKNPVDRISASEINLLLKNY
jgi:serine/threonine-protein kinase